LIQFAGTSLFGDTEFGVRFFSPLFAAILSVMVLRFFAREINARAAFWLLLIVTATPLLGVGAILMTIDPPLVLVLDVGAHRRLARGATGRTNPPLAHCRPGDGTRFSLQIQRALSNCVLGDFLRALPGARAHLRRPGPWLALLIFSLCTLPVSFGIGNTAGSPSIKWRVTPACTRSGNQRCAIFGIFS
jgi:hypothetical protein